MKRFFLSLLALTASISLVSAQDFTQSWWGLRGGVNFSNLSSPYYSTDYLTGFSVGAAYCYPLSGDIPIYIESGLYFKQTGARDNGYLTESGSDSRLIKHSFEVPLLVGYTVPLVGDWRMQASVGLYYSIAINGKMEIGDADFDPFKDELLQTLRETEASEQKLLQRSDFGVRIGLSALYKHYLFGFSYDAGVLNTYTRHFRDEGYRAQTGCFTLELGYNF